jgi:hypothetical protein
VLDTIAIEDHNVPAVGLSNEGFMRDAKSAAAINGMPGVRILGETIPVECTELEIIEEGVAAAMDGIIDALIRPLSEEEAKPTPEEDDVPDKIAFRGTIQEVNRFFYKRKWTDGLPILPPTGAAVAEMLEGTDLPPDHLIGKITPRWGKATVEKIAINAVMAGALPTYMPVLIKAVEAMLDPMADYGTHSVSTGSWAPHWIINGPIRHDLNLNSGSGMLSPGDMANSAIGRAMLLVIRNIGGAQKGIEDMGVLGNPGKYAAVMAENEEDSPWQPMHTEAGFDAGASTISVFFPNSYSQVWPYATNAKGVLNAITSNVIPGRTGLFCVVMNPANAKLLADEGWEKDQIKAYISEYARAPAYKHPAYWGAMAGRQNSQWIPLNANDSQRILRYPDWIKILVAGGPGAFMGLLTGGAINDLDWVTRKIELPANWNALVKKYGKI